MLTTRMDFEKMIVQQIESSSNWIARKARPKKSHAYLSGYVDSELKSRGTYSPNLLS